MAMQRYDAAVAEEEKRQWEAEQAEKKRQFRCRWHSRGLIRTTSMQPIPAIATEASLGTLATAINSTPLHLARPITQRTGALFRLASSLEGTGANGVNWNLWNDVWNGVSTSGIGGDTVGAFNRRTPASEAYRYLWG